MTMLTIPCAVCGAKAHIVGTRKTSTTSHAITGQCSRNACGHRWIATLTTARINGPHNKPTNQTEAPAQTPGSGTPSRASQRRKRRLLAKNKGKRSGAAQ
ncbi:hypothetical protein F1536_27800 [Achromobacter xylosoxidans]|uniref:ogr/Delta-like zinc finger family protein n=1 Tax=Alcaligenes xylosoxydans xylosoxydans TaxID=85698 RepID=UPI00123235EC|nr:ogr/Delta-like zinc finger family protein [Achromobacter xylosoxidans]KAA5919704.1 hypothetical protein F1536_27800 [Achromobacter xylosoxidans]